MSSLGAIDPIIINDWDGFDQPERGRVTPLLGDGTSTTGNAVIQQGALGFPAGTLGGVITSSASLALLRGYADAKDQIAFIHGATTYQVLVFNLRTSRLMLSGDEAWTFTCVLHWVA